MTDISLSIPQLGQPDSTEDVKVADNFTLIQAAINGGLDFTNLAANSGIAPVLTTVSSNVNAGVSAFQFVNMTGASTTATLEATPTGGDVCGVRAGASISGAGPITVSGNGNLIGVPGATTGVSTITLGHPASFVTLLWAGTIWWVIAGGEDTGWVALTLTSGVIAGDPGVTPSIRRANGRVFFQGTLKTPSGFGALSRMATIPSAYLPASDLTLNTGVINGSTHAWSGQVIASATLATGINTSVGAGSGDLIPLTGCAYSL